MFGGKRQLRNVLATAHIYLNAYSVPGTVFFFFLSFIDLIYIPFSSFVFQAQS
jgi:hypothetical protein